MRKRPWAVALAGLTVLAASGCSGGRDYAVPREICGVRMPKDVVEPLLPEGDSLRQQRRRSDAGHNQYVTCDVDVDGKGAFVVYAWEEDSLPKLRTGKDNPERSHHVKQIKKLPFSGWGTVSDKSVVAATKCENGKADSLNFKLLAQRIDDVQKRREASVGFIKKFVPGEMKKEGCTDR